MVRAMTAMGWMLAVGGAMVALADPVAAQAPAPNGGCTDIQKTLGERQSLIQQANGSTTNKKLKMSAQQACGLFTKMTANGTTGLKWIEANKEWCSIPESFVTGFKEDHDRVVGLRTKICNAAAQQAQMEKKARQQAQNNSGGGLLGGPGLTGSYKVPQGAL